MFSKVENNYIFHKKSSKIHEKGTILHVTITFFVKQGQTSNQWAHYSALNILCLVLGPGVRCIVKDFL